MYNEGVFSLFNLRSFLLVFQRKEGILAFQESWVVQEDEEGHEQLFHSQIEDRCWLLGRTELDRDQLLNVADDHLNEATLSTSFLADRLKAVLLQALKHDTYSNITSLYCREGEQLIEVDRVIIESQVPEERCYPS